MKKVLYSSLLFVALITAYPAQALLGEVFEGVGETTKAAGRTVNKVNPVSKENRTKKVQKKSNKTKKSKTSRIAEEADEVL